MNWNRRAASAVIFAVVAPIAVGVVLGAQVAPGVASTFELWRLRYLNKTLIYLDKFYVERERIQPAEMLDKAVEYVEREVPEVIVDGSAADGVFAVSVAGKTREFTNIKPKSIFDLGITLRDILKFVQAELGQVDTDRLRQVEYAAINGMLSTLDPHSTFLPPAVTSEVKLSTRGEFGGLGIVISVEKGVLVVVSPLAGTPASRMGLRAKDRIVRIEDESTVNMPLEEAVNRLRGPKGTKVRVFIMRDGWTEPKMFAITRDIIKIKSVIGKRLGASGYVRIKNFQENTASQLREQIREMSKKAPLNGLILDMRGNPGGLLDAAIDVSDVFLKDGVIVSTVGNSVAARSEKTAVRDEADEDMPVVVLVNSGSASASEIVAGALKYRNRALVLGERTFGKGSVQQLYPFEDTGGGEPSLKFTVAQYLTPGDISIQAVGINPDIALPPVFVNNEVVSIIGTDFRFHEDDLERPLMKGHESEPPRATVRYLHTEPPEKEQLEADADTVYEDFPIQFAKALLKQVPANHREEMLKKAMTLVAAKSEEQDAAIAKALAARGVDWALGADAAPATLTAKMEIVDEAPPVTAGEEISLKVTVANQGPGEVYRLLATSHSENSLFDRREFVLGRIRPGTAQSFSLPIKVPRSALTRHDQIVVKFQEARQRVPANLMFEAAVKSLPEARFEVAWHLDDKGKGGNGNGVLDIGETVRLKTNIKNAGEGQAYEVVAALSNESGGKLYIEKGRQNLGGITAGGKSQAEFEFSLKPGFEEKAAVLRLMVYDSELGEQVAQKLRLPVGAGAEGGFGAPRIMLDKVFNTSIVDKDRVKISGKAVDTDGLKDLYVLVNDQKLFYRAAGADRKEPLAFEAELPVDPGANFVRVIARQDDELSAQTTVVVSRPTEDPGGRKAAYQKRRRLRR